MQKYKKLIVANWKNHPDSLAEAEGILKFVNDYLMSINDSSADKKELSLVFCPPFVFIEEVAKILKKFSSGLQISLGAQNIAVEDKTSLTGEVSGSMLAKLGTRYVIIGHSERRWKLGESDEVVNKKLVTALKDGLVPIVCIGEKVRDDSSEDFLKKQVEATFVGLSADEISKCIIAYEPVWAISTNPDAKPDTPASALKSISYIRNILNTKYSILDTQFLYGGSISSSNVADFIKEKEIDGVLIGGASVNKEEFVKILKVIAKIENNRVRD